MFETLHTKKRSFIEVAEIIMTVALFVGSFIGIVTCFAPSEGAVARARATIPVVAAAPAPVASDELVVTFVPCLPGHAQLDNPKPGTALDTGAASSTMAPCDRNR